MHSIFALLAPEPWNQPRWHHMPGALAGFCIDHGRQSFALISSHGTEAASAPEATGISHRFDIIASRLG